MVLVGGRHVETARSTGCVGSVGSLQLHPCSFWAVFDTLPRPYFHLDRVLPKICVPMHTSHMRVLQRCTPWYLGGLGRVSTSASTQLIKELGMHVIL